MNCKCNNSKCNNSNCNSMCSTYLQLLHALWFDCLPLLQPGYYNEVYLFETTYNL